MAPTVNGVNGTARKSSLVNGAPSAWQATHNIASHFIGGSKLEKARPSKVKDFVQAHDGHSVITSVCAPCGDKLPVRAWAYHGTF
jgi:acetyl-CoA carboxylase/biotin carboxylase 1